MRFHKFEFIAPQINSLMITKRKGLDLIDIGIGGHTLRLRFIKIFGSIKFTFSPILKIFWL